MEKLVIKRDNTTVEFDQNRIVNAVLKAMNQTSLGQDIDLAEEIANKIENIVLCTGTLHIEEIQDFVENELINSNRKDVAKEYIRYRAIRNELRNEIGSLDSKIEGLIKATDTSILNENANKDGNAIPTQRDMLAGLVAKDYALRKMLPLNVAKAHLNGDIHYHDLSNSPLQPSFNCMLIDVEELFKGFKMGAADIDTPKSIGTACNIVAQIIAQVSSHIYGGNTIANIDIVLAPYVKKSFEKHFLNGMKYIVDSTFEALPKEAIKNYVIERCGNIEHDNLKLYNEYSKAYKYAADMTTKETYDGFQSLEYEINTLSTSNGQDGRL